MHEVLDGYIFVTFQDGSVIFFKDSYKKHCGYHADIRGSEGREQIQNALIQPHYVTSYPRTDAVSGRIVAQCKKYYHIIDKITTSRGCEFVFWVIILAKRYKKRKKVVTAYVTSALEYAMINDRIETIEYKNEYKKRYEKI